ncbi:MAG: hypothetical protein ISR77_15105 [Pirellulaceae bacterium]|nr:hypothetical protein [Pirellulaceae bacterium]
MNDVNSPLNLLVSLGSIVVAIVISRFLTVRITETLNKRAKKKTHPLQTPAGGALLFAVIFVVVWCVVSFIVYLPWLLVRL